MKTFKLYTCWLQGNQHEVSLSVEFQAISATDALEAIPRFVENRQRAMPDYFQTLCAVKLYPISIGQINEQGSCETAMGFNIMEWKMDHGYTLEEMIEYTKERIRRNQRRTK